MTPQFWGNRGEVLREMARGAGKVLSNLMAPPEEDEGDKETNPAELLEEGKIGEEEEDIKEEDEEEGKIGGEETQQGMIVDSEDQEEEGKKSDDDDGERDEEEGVEYCCSEVVFDPAAGRGKSTTVRRHAPPQRIES